MKSHLSPGAIALSRRCGVAEGSPVAQVELRQTGRIRSDPARKWMKLSARQTIDVRSCAFDWRATTGPFGAISIRDALEPGGGRLEVKALGFLPIAREAASPALNRGELMRYLAEVAWAPDAILANRELQWSDQGTDTLTIAAGVTSVVLTLGADGLIAQTFAPDRPRSTPGGFVPTPWRGNFWDYREISGRMIPCRASISWTVDSVEQVYGEFSVTDWQLVQAS